MPNYYQGRFKPKNPDKYMGNAKDIIYRSGWELKLMQFLDANRDVIKWGSEEVVIPYRSPVDNRLHRYFTDFIVKRKLADGTVKTVVIEVKPKAQTTPPDKSKGFTTRGKPKKKFLKEVKTYAINRSKWLSAEEFCKDRGWDFMIMTEDDIFG